MFHRQSLETSANLTIRWCEGDYSPAGSSATGSVMTGLRRAGARRLDAAGSADAAVSTL
jgi:hypothetical protein